MSQLKEWDTRAVTAFSGSEWKGAQGGALAAQLTGPTFESGLSASKAMVLPGTTLAHTARRDLDEVRSPLLSRPVLALRGFSCQSSGLLH